jgi:hypothetical protein
LPAGSDGTLYGITTKGGYFDDSALFKLSTIPPTSAALIDFYLASGGLAITFSAAPAQTWALQFSADLGRKDAWHAVKTAQTNAFGLARFTDSSRPGFYRAAKP